MSAIHHESLLESGVLCAIEGARHKRWYFLPHKRKSYRRLGPTHLPLNALRAFEASARHLSFTLAAAELSVTQAAVSQQVRGLEARLGVAAVPPPAARPGAHRRRTWRCCRCWSTPSAASEAVVQQFDNGHFFEVLTVGVVGTFAVGWLMPRLRLFRESCPFIDLRLMTHNNVVDLAAEGLDFAIRFGDGSWPGLQAEALMDAPLCVLCAPGGGGAHRTPRGPGARDAAALLPRGRLAGLVRRGRAWMPCHPRARCSIPRG